MESSSGCSFIRFRIKISRTKSCTLPEMWSQRQHHVQCKASFCTLHLFSSSRTVDVISFSCRANMPPSWKNISVNKSILASWTWKFHKKSYIFTYWEERSTETINLHTLGTKLSYNLIIISVESVSVIRVHLNQLFRWTKRPKSMFWKN